MNALIQSKVSSTKYGAAPAEPNDARIVELVASKQSPLALLQGAVLFAGQLSQVREGSLPKRVS